MAANNIKNLRLNRTELWLLLIIDHWLLFFCFSFKTPFSKNAYICPKPLWSFPHPVGSLYMEVDLHGSQSPGEDPSSTCSHVMLIGFSGLSNANSI